jgi:tight adherence protein B
VVLIAILVAAAAGWVWSGPTAASARLTLLTGGSREKIFRRLWVTLVERPRPAAHALAWRLASIELCQSLAVELSAGRPPGEALNRAVSSIRTPDPGVLIPVIAAARDGGDVATALLRAQPARGGEGLARLAACWRVSVTVGAGLTALVERLAASLREAEAHRHEVAAQLAGARATARMLAILPVLGLLMGAGLGMNPLSFLLGGPAGFVCLVVGAALEVAGVWWTRRLVAHAEEAPGTGGRNS